jgi:hypothetical protein
MRTSARQLQCVERHLSCSRSLLAVLISLTISPVSFATGQIGDVDKAIALHREALAKLFLIPTPLRKINLNMPVHLNFFYLVTAFCDHVFEQCCRSAKIPFYHILVLPGNSGSHSGPPKYRSECTNDGLTCAHDVTRGDTFDALPSWYLEFKRCLSRAVVTIVVGDKVDKAHANATRHLRW